MNKICAVEWKFFGLGLMMTALMAMLLFFGTTTNAASVDLGDLPMIKDEASMRSYQITQIRSFYMEVYGDRIVRDDKNPLWVPVDNPMKVLETIQSQTLKYHVTELGNVYLCINLINGDGYGTFYGYKNTEIVTNGAGGVLLKDNTIQLEMSKEVPIKIKMGSSDEYIYQIIVKIFDGNGNLINERSLRISRNSDGRLIFYYPTAYLGNILAEKGYSAEIILRGINQITGETITSAYNPTTGQQIVGYDGSDSMSKTTIKDMVYLSDNSDVVVKIATTNYVGKNPTYQLTLTETKDLKVYGKTTEGKVAKGVMLRQFDDYGNIIGEEHFDNMTTIWGLPAGTYHLWFDWTDGDLIDPEWYDWYYNWSYNGGMG